MAIAAVWREYNPSTGNLIGSVTSFGFGNVNIGEFSPVKVYDFYVPEASYISNVELEIIQSDQIDVNASPLDIGADGTSSNGNFGIEMDASFVPRGTLTRFFSGLTENVTVGTRSSNVSKYIFLNIRMAMAATGSGSVVYKVHFDYS